MDTKDLKCGDLVKLHLYDTMYGDKEIRTKVMHKVYTVYEKHGQLGIDFSEVGSAEYKIHNNDQFLPLSAFATDTPATSFEKVGTVDELDQPKPAKIAFQDGINTIAPTVCPTCGMPVLLSKCLNCGQSILINK